MSPVNGSAGALEKGEPSVSKWTRQADSPGKLGLFQFSQVPSRKNNALINWMGGAQCRVRTFSLDPQTSGDLLA